MFLSGAIAGLALFAAGAGAGFEWTFENIAIAIIIAGAIFAVVLVVLRAMGVTIPPWVWTVIWICVIAVKFIASLF